jgi:hypothetical protein
VRHVIVTRFSVPRLEASSAPRHADPEWLDERLALWRAWYVPSVAGLGVPVVLLCSSRSAEYVALRIRDLPWAKVEVQDDWRGGWNGAADEMVTRLDSDDAVRKDWLEAVEQAPASAEVICTRDFLRLEPASGRLHSYRRREPSPLAAFRGGRNPYSQDHKYLAGQANVHFLRGAYLLQVVHGRNLSNRAPSWWRFDRRAPRRLLADFGRVD